MGYVTTHEGCPALLAASNTHPQLAPGPARAVVYFMAPRQGGAFYGARKKYAGQRARAGEARRKREAVASRMLTCCLLVTRACRFYVFFAHLCQEMEGFARLALKYNLYVLSDEVRFSDALLRSRRIDDLVRIDQSLPP